MIAVISSLDKVFCKFGKLRKQNLPKLSSTRASIALLHGFAEGIGQRVHKIVELLLNKLIKSP